MALPNTYFSPQKINSIENCCADAEAFLELHCTHSTQSVDATGSSHCAICLNLFAYDPEAPIFGDEEDPDQRLVQKNSTCVYTLHVGCISEHTARSGTCPLCRCVWFHDSSAQFHNDWIRHFMDELSAGKYQSSANVPNNIITIDAEQLEDLVLILAYFLSTRGKQTNAKLSIASGVASSPDGLALIATMVTHIQSVHGMKYQKTEILNGALCFQTIFMLQQDDDSCEISPSMLLFMDTMAYLLFNTFDEYRMYQSQFL